MADIDQLLKPLMLGDLRAQLRARGVNPAGGQAELKERLKDHMLATGNFSLGGSAPPPIAGGSTMRFCSLGLPPKLSLSSDTSEVSLRVCLTAGAATSDMRDGSLANNYSRPGGQQNVGNFITDKPSSRVLAPPGGSSQIQFGNYSDPNIPQRNPAQGHNQYGGGMQQQQAPMQQPMQQQYGGEARPLSG